MNSRRLVVLVLALATAATTPRAQSNDDCLECHVGDPDVKAIAIEVFRSSVHRTLDCVDCHQGINDLPHDESLAKVSCNTCHDDAQEAYASGIHASPANDQTGDQPRCVDCHGDHDIFAAGDRRSRVYRLNVPNTCGRCHGDPEMAARQGLPATNVRELYRDSIHGRALEKSGLLVAANCVDCHGSHAIHAHDDSRSQVSRANIAATCGKCHAGIQEQFARSIHATTVATAERRPPVCNDCHAAHSIRRVDTDPWKLEIIAECGTCHAEQLTTYRDTYHGKVSNLGYTRVARCSDCHGSHLVLAASDPESTLAPGNIVATCAQCHPGATANFAQFHPHADHRDGKRYPILHATWLAMSALLISVFTFFGIHSSLWLYRSVREAHKGTS